MNEKIRHFHGKKVLVTGHTGFKGSWLALWMSLIGAKVYGLALDPPSIPSHFDSINLNKHLSEDYRLNIQDLEGIKKIIVKIRPDFIFHLAAQPLVRKSYSNPCDTFLTNIMGTVNVLEGVRELSHDCTVVVVTSDKCYKNVEWIWGYREIDEIGGDDPYSASKGAAELIFNSYFKSFFSKKQNIKIGVGRAGNVIGGGDWADDRIVPDCIRAWGSGEVANIRNPYSTRPWQHVLEPLGGYITLALALNRDKAVNGEAFNFGPNDVNTYSVKKLVETMAESWPGMRWVDTSDKEIMLPEAGLLKLDCTKAKTLLNWQSIMSFNETIKETTLWYKNYYDNPDEIQSMSIEQINKYSSRINWI
jgi:CDP-glucose 4,6-dehydratase